MQKVEGWDIHEPFPYSCAPLALSGPEVQAHVQRGDRRESGRADAGAAAARRAYAQHVRAEHAARGRSIRGAQPPDGHLRAAHAQGLRGLGFSHPRWSTRRAPAASAAPSRPMGT